VLPTRWAPRPRPVPQACCAVSHSVLSRIPHPACRRAYRAANPTPLPTSPMSPAKGPCVRALPSIGRTSKVPRLFRYLVGRALFGCEGTGFVHRLTRFVLLGQLHHPFSCPFTATMILVIWEICMSPRYWYPSASRGRAIPFLLRLRTSAPTAEMTLLRSRAT
jgi:hypothetical protein